MNTIVITTQEDFDKLPNSFLEFTIIRIESAKVVLTQKGPDNSSVEAYGNSSVEVYGNSSVRSFDNSSVRSFDNSSVEVYSNSSVEAYSNSSVRSFDNSSVEAYGNSSVEAYGNSSVEVYSNSSVEAYGNSSVRAYGNSSVELFISSQAVIFSSGVIVKKVLDYSTAIFKGVPVKVNESSETTLIREIPDHINPSFEEWLSRGYVKADGILKKLKSQKKINDIEIFECEDFPGKTTSFVVRRNGLFSHGETVEKAIEDLRYKIGDRNTSEFGHWKNDLDQEVSLDSSIAAYRTITGACEFGVKKFINSANLPEKLTPKIVLQVTEGRFGHEKFKQFLGVK